MSNKITRQIAREEKKALQRREQLNKQGLGKESSNDGKKSEGYTSESASQEANHTSDNTYIFENSGVIGKQSITLDDLKSDGETLGTDSTSEEQVAAPKRSVLEEMEAEKKAKKKAAKEAKKANAKNNKSSKKNADGSMITRSDIRKKNRKNKIEFERNQEELEREKYLTDNDMVEAVVPVNLQQKFLYYTTSVKKLEKRTRRLRATLTFVIIIAIVFVALFVYEMGETKRTYNNIYERAITDTIDTIKGQQANPIAGDRFYRMVTAETNTVRMAAENIGLAEEKTNKLNDVYYLMVNYPKQMEKKYQDIVDIYSLLLKNKNDKKAYDKIEQLKALIDKLGE